MRTRSGKKYTALVGLRTTSRDSKPKVTRAKLQTRTLLKAAVDKEDTRHTDDADDAEGATLEYGDRDAAGMHPGGRRMQARDLTLTFTAAPLKPEECRPAHAESGGSIERKRKRSQSNLRRKRQRISLTQSGIYEQPGLAVRPSKRATNATTTPMGLKTADLQGAGKGEYVGKRVAM